MKIDGTDEHTTFEGFIELSEVQQKIFYDVKAEWERRVGKGRIDEGRLKRTILMADTNGDGKKRVVVSGKTHLVPISDIILHGLQAVEIDKYPVIEE